MTVRFRMIMIFILLFDLRLCLFFAIVDRDSIYLLQLLPRAFHESNGFFVGEPRADASTAHLELVVTARR